MSGVIYADVLVVVNIYVTYFLLRSTALLCKENPNRLRLLLSSLLGGCYSLSILLPEKIQLVLSAARLCFAVIFIVIAFGYGGLRSLLRLNICFVLCSFIFAGLMLALWYFVCPSGMYFNGTVVYFNIDVLTLVLFTVVCYGFLKLFDLFFKSRAPINTIFYCKVFFEDEVYELKAFLDTGNNLTDPFTGKPVIIANRDGFKKSSLLHNADSLKAQEKIRPVLCSTVSGKNLLPAFSPNSVHINGADADFITDSVMIAITDEKLFSGEYDAILPMGLFDKINVRKDERESEENLFNDEKAESRNPLQAFSFTGVLCERTGESSSAVDQGKGKRDFQ